MFRTGLHGWWNKRRFHSWDDTWVRTCRPQEHFLSNAVGCRSCRQIKHERTKQRRQLYFRSPDWVCRKKPFGSTFILSAKICVNSGGHLTGKRKNRKPDNEALFSREKKVWTVFAAFFIRFPKIAQNRIATLNAFTFLTLIPGTWYVLLVSILCCLCGIVTVTAYYLRRR